MRGAMNHVCTWGLSARITHLGHVWRGTHQPNHAPYATHHAPPPPRDPNRTKRNGITNWTATYLHRAAGGRGGHTNGLSTTINRVLNIGAPIAALCSLGFLHVAQRPFILATGPGIVVTISPDHIDYTSVNHLFVPRHSKYTNLINGVNDPSSFLGTWNPCPWHRYKWCSPLPSPPSGAPASMSWSPASRGV